MTSPAQPPLPLALIVDDDPALRTLSRMSLEQDDLRVEEASSGQAAIDFAAVTMPDIIILDLQMPGMDGFVACQQLRQLARLSDDQFAVLLPHLSAPEDAAKVAQACMSALDTPVVIDGASVTLSAHIGIAIPGTDGADADALLRNA